MNVPDLIVRSRRVVTPTGVRPAAIHIRDGQIAAIREFRNVPPGSASVDAGELVVMPGLVDTHVHINEPGRTEWEGFRTATRAAAAGGVTTVVEMPLNSIPVTTSAAAYREKLAAAEGKLSVDTGFWGGVVPGNAGELEPMWQAGVYGFKAFLAPSGVPEFEPVSEADLRMALPILSRLGAPLLVHAELPGPIAAAAEKTRERDPRRYRTWLEARPAEAEYEAVKLLVELAAEMRARIHVVHLSGAGSVELIRKAQARRTPITAETCPHYLCCTSARIPAGATEYKCAPPIRDERNRKGLWEGLRRGTIGIIVTDHSPCPPEMKGREKGDFQRAWGGIASLELGLAAVWTALRRERMKAPLQRLAEWMCAAPARLAGLDRRKGKIAPGMDADLVVWDPESRFRVEPDTLQQRHRLTPYAGRSLNGVVQASYLRGRKIFDRGEGFAPPAGRVLRRGKR